MIKRPLAFMCLLFLLIQMILLNLTGGQSVKEMPASSIFQEREGEEVVITGQLYDKKVSEDTQILFLKNNSISNQNNSYYDEKIIVYDSEFTNISIGKTIYLKGKTIHFEEAHNPGNFDQVFYYAKEKIFGAVSSTEIIEVRGEADELRDTLYRVRTSWKQMLYYALGEEKGGILAAMLLGEKSSMDEDVKELYQKNGIGHVLAISGLHISFIGLGLYKIIRKTGCSFLLSGVTSMGCLSLYAVMIGFSVSVLRAYVMLLFRIGADVTGRVYDVFTALAFAAALSAGMQPLCLLDAGFYLSYGSILGIFLIVPRLSETKWGTNKLFSLCMPGMAINGMLLPIQLWFFYEFPLYSIILNLLIVPLMSVILGIGIFGSILGFLWTNAGILCLQPCKWILHLFELVSKVGITFPCARVVTGRPEVWEVLLYYVVLAVILLKTGGNVRRKSAFYILSILLLLTKLPCGVQVTMLDVGQGDGIYVRGPRGVTYFIDGGSSDVKEVGKYRIEPYLKYEGAGCLDYVFLTHGDADHYSGILEMLERQDVGVRIKNLVLPANYEKDEELLQVARAAMQEQVEVKVLEAGKGMKEGEFLIRCLQPEEGTKLTGNAGSMVLELNYGEFEMLCTGDVEGDGEELLRKKVTNKSYDVLKVAHHGSKYSSEEKFLDQITGKVALISAGRNNSYSHPHEETLTRLSERNYQIYNTMSCGAITIKTNGETLRLEVFH